MKATVKSVIPDGTWEAHGKTFHNFKITIGEHVGQYSTPKFTDMNSQDFPFKQGQESEYEYVGGEHPKIKLPKKEFNPSKGSGGSNASFALSYSKDVLVASYMTQNGDVLALSTDQMFALAEKMNNWLNDH